MIFEGTKKSIFFWSGVDTSRDRHSEWKSIRECKSCFIYMHPAVNIIIFISLVQMFLIGLKYHCTVFGNGIETFISIIVSGGAGNTFCVNEK